MTQYDAPNQQVVRPDGSGPWDEGDGGSTRSDGGDEEVVPQEDIDSMTKAQLLTYASDHDVDADDTMTKADIRAAIDKAAA